MSHEGHEQPEVVDLLRTLLRFDTTNHGPGRANGELEAARWVEGLLRDAGWEPVLLQHPADPRRASVVVRIEGADRSLPGVLAQGHLDVVPAEAADWSVDPFAGELRDGYVLGRGAVDMKDTCASMLAVALDWGRSGRRPRRDVVLAFVADEETDGTYGAEWLVEAHADLFAGVAAAVSESGAAIEEHADADGTPVRLARISAGERGTLHVRLTARGTSGHGSRPGPDNAVLRIVDALHRIGHHPWPVHLADVVRAQLTQTAAALGVEVDLGSDEGVVAAVAALGAAADVAPYTIRASTTPTVVHAGTKVNVVPGTATAEVDIRCPPGYVEQLQAALPALVGPDVEVEPASVGYPLEAPTSGPWWDAMVGALRHVDPAVVVVPGCMGGGTDAKSFARLGIACYGFAPATLDPEGRRRTGIHGVDERIPVSSLVGGLEALRHFLETV